MKRSLPAAFLCVLVCLSWTLSPAFGQGAYSLDQVLAKMDAVGKSFTSMQAMIERTKVTVIVNDKYTDSGNIYFVRRGKEPRIKIDLLQPERQINIIDKGMFRSYSPKLKMVQEHALAQGQEKTAEVGLLVGFGQSNEEVKKFYNVALLREEIIDGQKTSVLELKPKSAQASAMFTSILLWMDQTRWIPIQIRTNEASRDYMIVKFSKIRLNAKIPDSIFDLKLPKDVKTVKI